MNRRALFVGLMLAAGLGLMAGPALAVKLNIAIGSLTEVSSLGQYIQAFYRYFVGAIGIIAMAMIMYGGYRWIVAAGDSSQIQEAKSTIVAAIVGLFLALISFVFLNLINPELTALRDPNVSLQSRVLGLGYFCSQVPGGGAINDTCGTLKTVPNSQGKVCFGDLCPVSSDGKKQICVQIPDQEKPTCLDPDEACRRQNGKSCQRLDQQLIAAGEQSKACRKNDLRALTFFAAFGGSVTDVCALDDILTCPAGFERIGCNAAKGVDTLCFRNNQPAYCKKSIGGWWGFLTDVYGTCAEPYNTRAVEYADSICCSASDVEPAVSKQFVSCKERPNTLGGDQTEIEIPCLEFNNETGIPYRYSDETTCSSPKKCWAETRLVYRNGTDIDQVTCTNP